MNSKSTHFKKNSQIMKPQAQKNSTDQLQPPKTPMKRPHLEPSSNISSNLSPLPTPPKKQTRTGSCNFVPFEEMRQVETPLFKQKSKYIIDAEQQPIDHVIIGRMIFQSEEEEEANSSSQMDSSQEQEIKEQGEREQHSSQEEQGSQGSSSQVQGSKEGRKIGRIEMLGDRTARRPSKNNLKISSTQNTPGKKISCNCKKTKCLKLYCDCFRLNQTCDGCNCVGCHNVEAYSHQRSNAILALMDRNPDPFGQKIEADKHVKGCNCKKSNCLKKYCECYQAGLKCGQNCKCQQCKNMVMEKGNEQDKFINKNTAKKERRMLEI